MKFTIGTDGSLDTQGNPYLTFQHEGPLYEGDVGPKGFPTRHEAWAAYFDRLNAFIEAERAVAIEWRMPPEIEQRPGVDEYRVYSRLSVIGRGA